MTGFSYDLLLPAGATGAKRHNEQVLRDLTLGIEVTEPELAARCRLGNIDPQHDGSGSSLSAIEAAATWPLPPDGAKLVTIRPDLDAIGAMALLTYRAEGRMLTPPMKSRIAAVAKTDRFDRGPWPGRQPMPRSPDDLLADIGGDEIGLVTAAMRDDTLDVSERVQIAKAWLSGGVVPLAYAQAPRERAERLWRALETGDVLVEESRAPARLVEIVSEVDGALHLGYRFAPVVIALNPHFRFRDGAIGPKFTIAQYRQGHADLDKALVSIARMEDGWGGSLTIKGSPQGRPSGLNRDSVASAVVAALQETNRHEAGENAHRSA